MIIANPIYDIVFKDLMSNLDIARGVISTIISFDIAMLDFKARAHMHGIKSIYIGGPGPGPDIKKSTPLQLDFIGKIKLKNGDLKNIFIKLVNINRPHDLMRFHRYLPEQINDEYDVVQEDGRESRERIPVISIFFLACHIPGTLPAVIAIGSDHMDVLAGGEKIEEPNYYIRSLSDDSYVIQVPALQVELKTDLERVLSVFQQENFVDEERRHLKRYEHEVQGELPRMMLNRLREAAGNPGLHEQVQLEVEKAARMDYETPFQKILDRIKLKIALREKVEKLLERDIGELEKKIEELEHSKDQSVLYKKQLEREHKYITDLLNGLKKEESK